MKIRLIVHEVPPGNLAGKDSVKAEFTVPEADRPDFIVWDNKGWSFHYTKIEDVVGEHAVATMGNTIIGLAPIGLCQKSSTRTRLFHDRAYLPVD